MSEIDDIRGELTDLKAVEAAMSPKLQAVRGRIAHLRKRKVEIGDEQRLVTDHALLRYLERYHGVDVAAIRDDLRRMADEAVPAKDGEHHWHPSGVMLVLGEVGQVITVLSADQAAKHAGRKLMNGESVPAASQEGVEENG